MKKSATLTELLCQVKDKRRKQGRRHSLSDVLTIVIIGTMSGFYGYRSMEDFCQRYKHDLQSALGHPKHGLASYSAIRRVIMELDFDVVAEKFYQWIRGKVTIRKKEWMQIDGKGISGTFTDRENKYQNFLCLVSLFMNRTGVVLNVQKMSNRDQGEINAVQQLIASLSLKNIVISMDAQHCQKKLLSRLLAPATIMLLK